MNIKFRIPCLLTITFICSVISAQESIKVKEAIGRQKVEDHLTPSQAERMALQNAKSEALRKAGIPEKVWSVLGQITDSKNDELIEAYSEISTITLNGLVTVEEQKVSNLWDTTKEELTKEVTIKATVLKENNTDNEFVLDISGFNNIYKENEQLEFDVKVFNRNAYIKIFWFDSKEGALIHPFKDKDNIPCKANGTQHFPMGDYKYTLSKSDCKSKYEEVNIMIVATKENIPFVGKVNFQSVIKWIYKIPANARVSQCSRFVIM